MSVGLTCYTADGALQPPAAAEATKPAAAPAVAPKVWELTAVKLDARIAMELAALTAQVSRPRLMATIDSLPHRRSAGPTAEHAARLAATQELLAKELKAIGAEFTTQPVPLRRGWGAEKSKPKPSATDRTAIPATKPAEAKPGDTNPAETVPAATPAETAALHEWLNFIVDLPGEKLSREVLIITAHFDSVPDAPGADDDGTGTAAILEMVRLLKATKHERTLRLCLFNHEENGLIGSTHYARVWREHNKSLPEAEREKIIGMVSIDMMGYFSEKPDSQQNPFKGMPGVPEISVGDFLAICGSSQHRTFNHELAEAMLTAEPKCKTVVIDFFPNEQMAFIPPDLLRSDHAPFLNMGVTAIMLTDTSNFRNPNYHKATDTVATLDQVRYADGVRALTGATWLLAGPVEK